MMMPIVSMNKMAMNESVAATCCYRQVATPTAVYWEVLSGGWIGSGYVNSTKWNEVNAGTDDIENAVKGSSYMTMPYDAIPSQIIAGGAYAGQYPGQNTDGDWTLGGIIMDSSHPAYGRKCSQHGTESCYYFTSGPEYKTNRHFESTVKHSEGGTSWQAAHEAKQFVS